MAQKLFNDRILGLSHSAGNISISSGSRLTIGGQQYVTSSSLSVATGTLTANARYQVYAVASSGTVSLVVSSNENSVGPAGYTFWKLIGSFYANGNSSPAFGSFVNISGVPKTNNEIPFVGSGSWTNTTYSGFWERDGKNIKLTLNGTCTAVPAGGNLTFTIPFSTLELNSISGKRAGLSYMEDFGVVGFDGLAFIQSATQIGPSVTNVTGTWSQSSGVNATIPFSFNVNDFVTITKVDLPLTIFNATPIEDL